MSGNTDRGIQIDGASNNTLTSNLIGTDADGTHAVPNFNGGVHILGGTTSADTNTLDANVISGNDGPGVLIEATTADAAQANKLTANIIGTTARDTHRPLGNSGPGVTIAAGSGASQEHRSATTRTLPRQHDRVQPRRHLRRRDTSQNKFVRNSIRDNGGAGIDLKPGANDDIAAPVLNTATREARATRFTSPGRTRERPTRRTSSTSLRARTAAAADEGDRWLGSVLQAT